YITGGFKTLFSCRLYKTNRFDKIMIMQPACLFLPDGIGGVADIPYRHNAVLQHAVFCISNSLFYNFCTKIPLLYYAHQEIDHTGFFWNNSLHMAQFQMTVAVYKTGAQDACKSFNICSGFSSRHNIANLALGRCN